MATITIELDFEHLLPYQVTDKDVYDYLMALIEDESLGYEVQ
jgi:hypothetical protein